MLLGSLGSRSPFLILGWEKAPCLSKSEATGNKQQSPWGHSTPTARTAGTHESRLQDGFRVSPRMLSGKLCLPRAPNLYPRRAVAALMKDILELCDETFLFSLARQLSPSASVSFCSPPVAETFRILLRPRCRSQKSRKVRNHQWRDE